MSIPPITDPMAVPTYRDTRLNRFFSSLLYDPRDLVFVWTFIESVALMLLLQAVLFTSFSWWMLPLFMGAWGYLLSPPILMLHNTMHRPFFRKARFMNRVVPYAISVLYGVPTGYMEHHVGMHHVENNLRTDLSSTMRYQRDNPLHWLHYFVSFMFTSHVRLTRYLTSHRRERLGLRAVTSDLVHLAIIAVALVVHWRWAVVGLVLPYVGSRVGMMLGNWGQHAFIDRSRPGDSYVNSITCINSGYNRRAFNDGYHIGHHLKQNRHWSEMPRDFLDSAERYAKEGCIVFKEIDFFFVSLVLFSGRYDILARKFVRLPGDTRTDEEVIAFLKSRTARIPDEVPDGVVMNA